MKIIDFGMSKFVQKRKYFQVICGTPVSRTSHTAQQRRGRLDVVEERTAESGEEVR